MNIKEHIEAGHYPTDDKGRALVPIQYGGSAVITATDGPTSDVVLMGWVVAGRMIGQVLAWSADGVCKHAVDRLTILPPPPRKVTVTRWAVIYSGDQCHAIFSDRESAEKEARGISLQYHPVVVCLYGEYEEPWS